MDQQQHKQEWPPDRSLHLQLSAGRQRMHHPGVQEPSWSHAEPLQLLLCQVEEWWLSSECLTVSLRPSHPPEEAHLCHLNPQSHSFSYPEPMVVAECLNTNYLVSCSLVWDKLCVHSTLSSTSSLTWSGCVQLSSDNHGLRLGGANSQPLHTLLQTTQYELTVIIKQSQQSHINCKKQRGDRDTTWTISLLLLPALTILSMKIMHSEKQQLSSSS